MVGKPIPFHGRIHRTWLFIYNGINATDPADGDDSNCPNSTELTIVLGYKAAWWENRAFHGRIHRLAVHDGINATRIRKDPLHGRFHRPQIEFFLSDHHGWIHGRKGSGEGLFKTPEHFFFPLSKRRVRLYRAD